MKEPHLTLCESDFDLLVNILSSGKLSEYNQARLLEELKLAKVVKIENLPLNVVSSNSRVLLWNMNKHQTFSIDIVQAEEQVGKESRVSVHDPISVALMGYPSGAVAKWELPGGITRLKIISVDRLNTEASNTLDESVTES